MRARFVWRLYMKTGLCSLYLGSRLASLVWWRNDAYSASNEQQGGLFSGTKQPSPYRTLFLHIHGGQLAVNIMVTSSTKMTWKRLTSKQFSPYYSRGLGSIYGWNYSREVQNICNFHKNDETLKKWFASFLQEYVHSELCRECQEGAGGGPGSIWWYDDDDPCLDNRQICLPKSGSGAAHLKIRIIDLWPGQEDFWELCRLLQLHQHHVNIKMKLGGGAGREFSPDGLPLGHRLIWLEAWKADNE